MAKCIGWRVETGFVHPYCANAYTIVYHETKVLGNDIEYDTKYDDVLTLSPASRLVWVCEKKEDALRYGENPIKIYAKKHIVVGHDKEGGSLVLITER